MRWPLLARSPRLAAAERARRDALRALPPPARGVPPEAATWVVVDVESTGLDLSRDRLIAIGAVRVTGMRIDLGSAFHVVLRQAQASDTANILVHGISHREQLGGEASASALLAFREFARDAHLVAFRAPFDQTMIDRAEREHLGARLGGSWFDLAYLAPALGCSGSGQPADLDRLLAAHGITVYERHDALADALATAQLLLVVLDRARARSVRDVDALARLADAERWLQQRR